MRNRKDKYTIVVAFVGLAGIFFVAVAPAVYGNASVVPQAEESQESGLAIDEFSEVTSLSPFALRVSLDDVSYLALLNSLDIQIARFDAAIAHELLPQATSIFDTILKAQATHTKDKREPASALLGEESRERIYSIGVEKKLPTGTTVSVEGKTVKTRSDSAFALTSPLYEAQSTVTVKQALGKNFFGLADRGTVKITKLDIENAQYTSLDSIEASLAQIQKSYWELVRMNENLAIKKDMLTRAQKLYAVYEEKLSFGLVERADVLAIEALVHTRASDVAIARLQKETAKNQLIFLLNVGGFDYAVEPTEGLLVEVDTVTLTNELRDAIPSRRDYQRARNDVKKNNITIQMKKNALWPEIDLTASLIRNNLGDDYEPAWRDIGQEANDKVYGAVTVTFPLENRHARAQVNEARIDKERVLLKLKQVERRIVQELNDNVMTVNTFSSQVGLYQRTVGIHAQKLEEELKRFHSGRSSADTLIRYEEDLLNARLKLVEYLYQYRTSLIDLEVSKNTLLDTYWDAAL